MAPRRLRQSAKVLPLATSIWRSAAHSLKGSSGNLGAKIVQEICEQLQISTRAHELETSRKLAPMLKENYAVAEDALKQVLAQYQ